MFPPPFPPLLALPLVLAALVRGGAEDVVRPDLQRLPLGREIAIVERAPDCRTVEGRGVAGLLGLGDSERCRELLVLTGDPTIGEDALDAEVAALNHLGWSVHRPDEERAVAVSPDCRHVAHLREVAPWYENPEGRARAGLGRVPRHWQLALQRRVDDAEDLVAVAFSRAADDSC